MKPKLVASEPSNLEQALANALEQDLAEQQAVDSIERATAQLDTTEPTRPMDYARVLSDTRAWCDRHLPDLAGAKADLQTRHAAAKAAYEAKVAKAKDEYNTITEVIDQQLYGITTTLEILTRAQDELTKAELPR